MLKDYLIFSIKNVRNRRLRSWLTMLGIIIGITAIVSLIGMGQGLQVAITSQFGSLGTDKLTIQASGGFGPPGTAVIKPLTQDNLDKLEKIQGVQFGVGRLVRPGKLEFNEKAGFGYAASMADGQGRKLMEDTFNLEAEQGRLLRDGDTKKVMLGYNLGLDKNGFDKPIRPGSIVILQGEKLEVIGILKKQGNFIFDSVVFMNEQDLRDLLNIPSKDYDILVLQVDTKVDIVTLQKNVEKVMRKERDVKGGEEDFTVQTPQAILDQVNSTLFAVQLFVYIIAAISIVVGGIGIMNTMFTSVLERTRDIGIMKSIGATNYTIFIIFFIESGFIGTVGGIIGALIGWGFAVTLALVGKAALGSDLIQANISPMLILFSILGSFLLGSLFGIILAIRASKLHPVDALRHKK